MLSEFEKSFFWISVLIITIFSAIGSFIIIISILLKGRKDLSAVYVLYLSIADFSLSMICLGFCANNYHHGYLQHTESFACQSQSIVTWYFMEASILWLTVISIHSERIICRSSLNYNAFSSDNFKKWQIIANIFCWGTPLITTFLPLNSETGESYGHRNGLWCTFEQKNAQLANISFYYFPSIIIMIVCYFRIGRKINFIHQSLPIEHTSQSGINLRIIKRLFFFVAAYIVTWTPLLLCYIYEASTKKYVPFPVEYIADNLLHIQGVFNFILYGLNNQLIHNIKHGISFVREYISD